MLITPSQYPQFADTSLESLTLSLARKTLEIQKNPALNLTNDTIIDIKEDLTKEVTTVTLKDLQATIDNGTFLIKNYFNYDFTDGTGIYPFNRTSLVDALIHVLMFQQKQELIIAQNPGSLMCIDFDFANVTEMNMAQQLLVNATLTDYPITVTNGTTNVTAAKPYLI
ncbi:hypothetical protein PCC9214_05345 [Planktothrix tepida]|uniref:Uncharacterized protein n=1 Tax=Planktothrix tepida PCC 9214 TaxID=671072 RepID=A0A1J1LI11_9CYAN|nr:hypothetical protein [Planktothrix tepida]CAD5984841.1 hypothetical protein PCC9214_05307 [Planktothrix tepida]CAD5985119.1 hypothetical protein PCC9214_05345 [Planktothrix tepida]CUR32144.1 conserved hypothetical protein [Planktothrix tepida PCC 9214]